MKQKLALQQKIKQIKKLNCLLSIVFTILILGAFVLISLAFIFDSPDLLAFASICAAVLIPVDHFKMREIYKENILHLRQKENDEKNSSRCELCDITFDSEDQLLIELKKDGYGDCYFCPNCGKKLTN